MIAISSGLVLTEKQKRDWRTEDRTNLEYVLSTCTFFIGGDIQLQRHSIFYKYLKRSVYEGFARYHSVYARLLEMELLSNVTLEHLNIHYSTWYSTWPNFEYQSTRQKSIFSIFTILYLVEGREYDHLISCQHMIVTLWNID